MTEELTAQGLANLLLTEESVAEVVINTTVEVNIKRVNTGEVDDVYNPIRERMVSEDEMKEIADLYEWEYLGEVDLKSDYRVTDKLQKRMRFEND